MRISVANLLIPLLLITFLLPAVRSADRPDSQGKNKSKTERAVPSATLTGCVDEKDGRYTLVDDRTLNFIADLEAVGFETEGFAKHLGHKVTVRGQKAADGDRPVFKVRSITTVSETCAPAQAPQ